MIGVRPVFCRFLPLDSRSSGVRDVSSCSFAPVPVKISQLKSALASPTAGNYMRNGTWHLQMTESMLRPLTVYAILGLPSSTGPVSALGSPMDADYRDVVQGAINLTAQPKRARLLARPQQTNDRHGQRRDTCPWAVLKPNARDRTTGSVPETDLVRGLSKALVYYLCIPYTTADPPLPVVIDQAIKSSA